VLQRRAGKRLIILNAQTEGLLKAFFFLENALYIPFFVEFLDSSQKYETVFSYCFEKL
jgi:hypothetical protein